MIVANNEPFIVRINKVKSQITNKHKIELLNLYKRIGNDLLAIPNNQGYTIINVINNYKPDYIYLTREIFTEIKNKLGFTLRQDLGFKKNTLIEIKNTDSTIETSDEQQDITNTEYSQLFTLFLNNRSEDIINSKFIESEAKYFDNLLKQSKQNYQERINKTKDEILNLDIEIQNRKNNIITTSDKTTFKKLVLAKAGLEKILNKLQNDKKGEHKEFITKFENNIQQRADDNTQYIVGQGSNEIRTLEYEAIKNKQTKVNIKKNNIITSILATQIIKPTWWELSQFIKNAKPRINHLAISGTTSNSDGYFLVGGVYTKTPRNPILPDDEIYGCRCEVEYKVSL